MNPFSRIIARPFFAQQRTLDVVADEPAVPQAFAHPVNTERRSSDAENIDLLQKFVSKRCELWQEHWTVAHTRIVCNTDLGGWIQEQVEAR